MNMFAPQTTLSFQQADAYQALKGQLHRSLIDLIEEEQAPVAEWSREVLRRYVEGKIDAYVAKNRLALNRRELESLTDDMMDEINGLGPIQSLIDDDEVNDILVNGYKKVFVERRGRLEATNVRFVDDRHVLRIIQRIVAPLGRRVDESNPMVDARLTDGSRVNAIIAPLALDGPSLSIRKFRQDPLRAGDM
ncbi:MAG: ATPase, T2SS/T4P/T4SS family, partial [Candidatus Binatia bacterium]